MTLACALVVGSVVLVPLGRGDTETYTVIPQNSYTTPPWMFSGQIPAFTQTYARIDSETLTFFGALQFTQTVTNTTTTNNFYNVTGSATFATFFNGQSLASYVVQGTGSEFIQAGQSRDVTGIGNATINTNLPTTSANPGMVSLMSYAGTAPRLLTQGAVRVSYNYTPIGQSQQDAIQPGGTTNGTSPFQKVPSDRWFSSPANASARYEIASAGDAFAGIAAFPMGFGGVFDIMANGTDYGLFRAGDSLLFPAGTTSFTVLGVDPTAAGGSGAGFPLKLAFNRDGIDFNVIAPGVPEPSTAALASLTLTLGVAWRRRTARARLLLA